MARQDLDPLQLVGITVLVNLAGLTSITLLYGVFILLFSISTASILRRGLMSHSTQAMFSVTLISFVLATIYWAVVIAVITILIRSVLLNNLDLPWEERFGLANQDAYKPQVVALWTSELLPIISDIVVIWRAWVLFSEHLWIMIGPLFLLLGTIATTFAYLGLTISFDGLVASSIGTQKLINDLLNASLALSLATNALATILIGYKLWTHRRFITKRLSLARNQSRGQNVLIILLESGVVYFGLQLATLILNVSPPRAVAPGSAKDFAAQIFFATYTELSAMYPTIVVVLVNQQRSFVDTCGFSNIDLNDGHIQKHNTASRPATFGHLSFAVPHSDTTAAIADSLESPNTKMGNRSDEELRVFEKGILNGVVDVEKGQAKTAPF